MGDKKVPKSSKLFFCIYCDYSTSRESQYIRHLSTRKHKMVTNGDKDAKKNADYYICECGNSYKHRQGLSRHKKTCTFISEEKETNDSGNGGIDKEILLQVIQNQNNLQNIVMEQGKMMIDQGKQHNDLAKKIIDDVIPKIGNTTNTNCHNTTNKFNMNFFLNETCKDAIPLVEFINNLKLTVEDLDNTGKEVLVKGLTDIITKG